MRWNKYPKVWATVKVDGQPVISKAAIKAKLMFYKKNERASNLASRIWGEKVEDQQLEKEAIPEGGAK